MAVSTYTLLDAVKLCGDRVMNFGARRQTLVNPDPQTERMIEIINDVIRELFRWRPLPAASGTTVIETVAKYETGSVALTQGSAAVTGTDTVWTEAMVGRAFQQNSTGGIYRISSVESATALTLDQNWTEANTTTAAYTIAQDRYDLPAFFSDFQSVMVEGSVNRMIEVRNRTEIDEQRFLRQITPLRTGVPLRCTVWQRTATDGVWQIELDPFPDLAYLIRIRYLTSTTKLRNDGDLIPLPDEEIDYLWSGVRALWDSYTKPGKENAYRIWKQVELVEFAARTKNTEERTRFVPDDIMRSRPRVPYPVDWKDA